MDKNEGEGLNIDPHIAKTLGNPGRVFECDSLRMDTPLQSKKATVASNTDPDHHIPSEK